MIGELGPQLFAADVDPAALRDRVLTDIRAPPRQQEAGIAREDRERLAEEIADDILGHGPLERPLADDTITEMMINGPHDIWIERGGRLHPTPIRFTDESHLRRIINKIVAQVGPPHRRVLADGRRAPAGRQPRERGPAAALAHRSAGHDPEVLARSASISTT